MVWYNESAIEHIEESDYVITDLLNDDIQFNEHFSTLTEAVNDYIRTLPKKEHPDDKLDAILYSKNAEDIYESNIITIDSETKEISFLDETMCESVIDDQISHIKKMKTQGLISKDVYEKQIDMLMKRKKRYDKNIKKEEREKKEKEENKSAFDKLKDKYFSKNNQKVVTESSEEEYFTENYLINGKDIYYNKNKFDSGEINLCFITGQSGSGKSTLGERITKEFIQLDDVITNFNFSDADLKEYGNLISKFFNQNKKYRLKNKDDIDSNGKDGDFLISMIKDFISFSISYAKSHKDEKIVIEGVELYWLDKPEMLKDYAVYIKGTSALISAIRAAKRDSSNDTTGTSEFISSFFKMMTNKKRLHGYRINEGILNKWRKYYEKLMKEQEKVVREFSGDYISESKLNTHERDELKDSDFGLPEERKFPLTDEVHIRQAIKMFSYCPKNKKKELRKNINKKIKEFNLDIDFNESTEDLSHDWSYIMESVEEDYDVFVEAAGNSTLLRDFISPFIEDTFKGNPGNVRKFNQLVSNYINRNITKLTTSGPVYLIPFTDNDKAQYYTLFGITEKQLKTTMKEHTKTLGSSKFLLLNRNPIFSLFYFVIRYFTIHPDKKSLNSALSIYALSAYPSIYTKYFPNGVIEPVMKYTIDNMTDKFLIKKTNHVFGALVESIQNSYKFLKPYMKEGNDKEVIRFIQRIRNDHNSMFKKIANIYMENYKNGNAVVTTNTMYDDDTPIIDEVSNASTEVQNAVLKVSMPIITNGVDIVRAEASAKMAGVGISDCRFFLTELMTEKNVDELQKMIESILFLYIYEDKKRIRDVRSQYFLAWAASLFKKTNSKNDNIERINSILNQWSKESGVDKKYSRIASRINYKKAIFFYIILSIQKYIA